MNRTTRTILALAAGAAAAALALPVTSASATTSGDHEYWGPYYSSNHKAKSRGAIDVDWDDTQTSNSVHVTGRLDDLDHRTYGQGGKCAFVKFQVHHFKDDYDHWYDTKSYKYCNAGHYKKFSFWKHDVNSVRVKVCQIGLHAVYATKCGDWNYLYTTESE